MDDRVAHRCRRRGGIFGLLGKRLPEPELFLHGEDASVRGVHQLPDVIRAHLARRDGLGLDPPPTGQFEGEAIGFEEERHGLEIHLVRCRVHGYR